MAFLPSSRDGTKTHMWDRIGARQETLREWGFAILGLAIYSCILLWPAVMYPQDAMMPLTGTVSDLTQTDWPYAILLQQTINGLKEIPLWNPLTLGGEPLAANTLFLIWYPPSVLMRVIFSPPLSFNVLYFLHIVWAGLGMYGFLMGEGVHKGAAFVGALIFAGSPKVIAHIAVGHTTFAYAIAWTPWLLASTRLVHRRPSFRAGLLTGTILAMIVIIDPRWAVLAGYLFAVFWLHVESANLPNSIFSLRNWIVALRSKLNVMLGVLLAVASLSAIQVLPTLEFMRESTRAAIGYEQAIAFSIPWQALWGLVAPTAPGSHEWVTYLGQATMLLGLVSVLRRRPGVLFWWLVLVVAAIYSFGPKGLLYQVAYDVLPGVKALRVPARSWFIVDLASAALASYGLDTLLRWDRRLPNWMMAAVITPAVALLVVAAWGFPQADSQLTAGIVSVLAILSGLWVVGRIFRPTTRLWQIGLIFAIVVFDMTWAGSQFLGHRSIREVFGQAVAADWLASQERPFRVYSPSFSISAPLAANLNLEQINGVNSLQLADFSNVMRRASGVAYEGYSVTVPPFLSADLATANADAIPDPKLLGLLNVKYVVTEFDLAVPGLVLVERFDRTRIYQNEFARPRVWLAYNVLGVANHTAALESTLSSPDITVVEGGTTLSGSERLIPVQIISFTPNHIALSASLTRPALLVLSEMYYPGWQAIVDGKPTPIVRVNGLLRGVYLQPGAHAIEFSFRPLSLYASVALLVVFTVVGLCAQKMKW